MAHERNSLGILLLLAVAAILGPTLSRGGAQAPGEPVKPLLDLYGDPLPYGAISRMGTVRFRTSSSKNFKLSGDAKTLVLQPHRRDPQLEICDAESGQRLYVVKSGIPEPVWAFLIRCFEPIKNIPLFSDWVKTSTWFREKKTRWTVMELLFQYWPKVQFLSFSPDNRLMAVSKDGRIRLLEARTGQEVRILEGAEVLPCHGIFTDDGKRFGILAADGEVRLWDVAAGQLVRSVRLSAPVGSVRPVFSPNLHWGVCTTDDHTIEVWDLTKGLLHKKLPPIKLILDGFVFTRNGQTLLVTDRARKTLHCFEMGSDCAKEIDLGAPIYPLSIVCSPDGARFAAPGVGREGWHSRIWDLKTGKQIAHFRADPASRFYVWIPERQDGHELAFSQDGKQFALVKDQSIQLFDVATQKMSQALKLNGRTGGAIAFALNDTMIVGQDGDVVRFWNTVSGRERPTPLGLYQATNGLQFGPDGRTLVSSEGDGPIASWDAATGSLRHRFEDRKTETLLGISRDGNRVLSRHSNPRGACLIRGVDFRTTSKLFEFKATPNFAMMGDSGFLAAMSPEGRTFAFSVWPTSSIDIRDGAAGNVRFEVAGKESWGGLNACCFSPDGKVIACHYGSQNGDRPSKSTIALYEATTGRLITSKSVPVNDIIGLAYSPDGKWLIGQREWEADVWEVATLTPILTKRLDAPPYDRFVAIAIAWDGRILALKRDMLGRNDFTLVELGTSTTVCTLPRETMGVSSAAFSPGGKRLAAGSFTPDILVWELDALGGQNRTKPPQLSQQEVENCWQELGAQDGAVAFRAQRRLWQCPQIASALVKSRIRPDVPMPLEPLIAALDDPSFQVRDRATKELEKLGGLAGTSIRAALAKSPTLEVRRRLEAILEHIPINEHDLRQARAVQLLEHIGNAEANAVLRLLADGWAHAPLTIDANASLERLARRETAVP